MRQTPETNSTRLLSVAHCLEALGIGRTRFYELLNNGTIKALKSGRRTLVHSAEIDRFIANLEAYGRSATARKASTSSNAALRVETATHRVHSQMTTTVAKEAK